jgi:threonine dehydratase
MKIELAFEARMRLASHLPPTPLVFASALSERAGRAIWLKLETTQPTGSFKVRPALNGILSHLDEARARGVIASSSGNFAQAVAWAAKKLGVDAMIVMTSKTSPYKAERTRALGAQVVTCGPSFKERWDTTYRLQRESGRVLVHPYDTSETIAGDATIALELIEQHPGPATVVVPTSGGGMIAGVAATLKQLRPETRVIGAQPAAGGAMARSLEAGKPVDVGGFDTIADALVASRPGDHTFELARQYVDGIVLASEDEIRAGVRFLFEEQKLLAEPGGAIAAAAVLAGKIPGTGDVVCIVSGGNVEPRILQEILS